MSIPYNILLKAKTGNFCCVKGDTGPQGPTGPTGPRGPTGHCDLSAVSGINPNPGLPFGDPTIDGKSFTIKNVGDTTRDGFNIVKSADPQGVYFLPFGGDDFNNNPLGYPAELFNHSSWLKVLPDWTDICNNQNPNKPAVPDGTRLQQQQSTYAYVPMYWYYQNNAE